MRLATIRFAGREVGGLVTGKGILPLAALNEAKGTAWPEDLFELIRSQELEKLNDWYRSGGREEVKTLPGVVPQQQVVYAPLYRHPKRIFGISKNYWDNPEQAAAYHPFTLPGSFLKLADTLIGPCDDIHLPRLKIAQRTTAESELGIILGKDCRDVAEEDWESAIAGYTTTLDIAEESLLKGNDYVQGNPRYLALVKNFPTFFSFGPELVTKDEVPDVLQLKVQCILNGRLQAENVVSNMIHKPAEIVVLNSQIMGWYAGDVITTGTPIPYSLKDGDAAECRIFGPDGFAMEPLINPVVDLKKHPDIA